LLLQVQVAGVAATQQQVIRHRAPRAARAARAAVAATEAPAGVMELLEAVQDIQGTEAGAASPMRHLLF
jgi:hypothetical protein